MSLTSSRVLLSTRSVSRSRRGASLLVAAALLLTLGACATLAPGANPVVVRTEQALEAALAVYDAGMTWCESHPQMLTADAAKIAEAVRTAFPPTYRSVDSGLQIYKAGKGAAPDPGELNRLVAQLVELVRLAGGPDLTGAKKTSDVRLMQHERPIRGRGEWATDAWPVRLALAGERLGDCTADHILRGLCVGGCTASIPPICSSWRVGGAR